MTQKSNSGEWKRLVENRDYICIPKSSIMDLEEKLKCVKCNEMKTKTMVLTCKERHRVCCDCENEFSYEAKKCPKCDYVFGESWFQGVVLDGEIQMFNKVLKSKYALSGKLKKGNIDFYSPEDSVDTPNSELEKLTIQSERHEMEIEESKSKEVVCQSQESILRDSEKKEFFIVLKKKEHDKIVDYKSTPSESESEKKEQKKDVDFTKTLSSKQRRTYQSVKKTVSHVQKGKKRTSTSTGRSKSRSRTSKKVANSLINQSLAKKKVHKVEKKPTGHEMSIEPEKPRLRTKNEKKVTIKKSSSSADSQMYY